MAIATKDIDRLRGVISDSVLVHLWLPDPSPWDLELSKLTAIYQIASTLEADETRTAVATVTKRALQQHLGD